MALCLGCRDDDHAKHTSKVALKIGGKGLGSQSRQGECSCSVCVRREAPVTPPSPTQSANPPRPRRSIFAPPLCQWKWTADPCADCGDPSHWIAERLGANGTKVASSIAEQDGKPAVYCFGCPRCRANLFATPTAIKVATEAI